MPARQRLHCPQPAWISTVTRWPILYSSTPGPSAATVPMYSWPGVICVGAAIRDHNGAVVGAISASTPTMRASDAHLTLVREEVLSAVRALSAEMGGPGSSSRAHAQ